MNVDQKGYGHGTCTLSVHDTVLKDNITVATQIIIDNHSVNPVKLDIIT
jgi:hypothetical protein